MKKILGPAILSSALLLACGGGDDTASPDAGTNPDAGDGFVTLIQHDWTLVPGQEGYVCIILTLQQDTFINAFDPIIPLGTHHTVFSTIDANDNRPTAPHKPDGTYLGSGYLNGESHPLGPDDSWCNGFTSGSHLLFGSGVGTERAELPPGIAVEVKAGQQVILNLHLFNVGDADLSGTSGVRIKTVAQSEVQHVAEGQLMGPVVNLQIPAGAQNKEITGTCTNTGEAINVLSVTPHMHVLGKHLKTELVRADATVEVMHDADYSFDDQVAHRLDPVVTVMPGDQIRTTCTYDNPTANEVDFGESSTTEMCMSGLLYYPAQNRSPYCDDQLHF